ncbi:LYR motif-containing protein 4 [Rhizophagus clarus]|uniref:LYR motif-containing protein 4 n=1 Tax=Rhizophagus clarus TaxID=94130 RepID=A0A8H3LV66_9GLOM|nr:LYR motif-containing protein 4 [Rhizophagus clarus]
MTSKQVLPNQIYIPHFYRPLLRESQKFSSCNFRDYAYRKIRDSNHANKNETDSERIMQLKMPKRSRHTCGQKKSNMCTSMTSTSKSQFRHFTKTFYETNCGDSGNDYNNNNYEDHNHDGNDDVSKQDVRVLQMGCIQSNSQMISMDTLQA